MLKMIACCTTVILTWNAYGQGIRNDGPHLLVYKTKQSYEAAVPVFLSHDKKSIVSYPDPADLRVDGMLPTKLHKGYLLDNKGISVDVAYLNMTWSEYANRTDVLSLNEMWDMIADKDPLVFLCDCGPRNRFSDPVAQANRLVDKKLLKKKCRVLVAN